MPRFLLLLVAVLTLTQSGDAQPTTPDQLATTYAARKRMESTSMLRNYPTRNIGPTVQGGRIIDIDVNLRDTKVFYVAFASGGVFKTENNGISFTPIFDNVDALGVGDIALSQTDPNVLYVGTGEKNSSRSSYAGSGVYKTTDGGQTWTSLGLTGTQHISRVVIHPSNNDIVWVAAAGSLYSSNPDRGVFKTTDGGRTWKKTLFINDSTGVIDLVVNPRNPDHLWASAWERERKASNFKGNGPGSAIYRSLDGGETWEKSVEGFPTGKIVGRIGLEISPSHPNILYAILDNQGEVEDTRQPETPNPSKLKLDDFKRFTMDDVLNLENKKLDAFLDENGFPDRYDASRLKMDLRNGKYQPKDIATYFGADANSNLFNTKVIGAEMYRSDDGGVSWKKMNKYDLDGVFYTYGYYFGEMRVSPTDPDLLYLFGVPLLKSRDGGVTWHRLDTLRGVRNVHVDHHALWINPNDPRHILLGNDGGLYQSYDEGAEWLHINNMPVGQFYTVNVDMEKPYNVYGGLQDNGVLKGSSRSVPNQSRHWEEVLGGDGMYVAADPRNSKVVYAGYQFGNYFRIDGETGRRVRITPSHEIGEQPLRWNWRAPLLISHHNADIIYMAANRVYRSLNQGETWEAISQDLTRNLPQGNVPFSTIASLDESSLKFGLLYAGTDDGNVWVSQDAGGSWAQINNGLPANKWVSSVKASPHDEATVFVTLNGYREDDFRTWIFMSEDYGKTWKSLKSNLPESVANVLIQDPENRNLLFCGLDIGTFASVDRGVTWHLMNGMLNVPAYDMMVHPRDGELVVGTHGRSVFVADIKPLRELADAGANRPVLAFGSHSIRFSDRWGEQSNPWAKPLLPSLEILYYAGAPTEEIDIQVFNEKNEMVRALKAPGTRGFNVFKWDVKVNEPSATTRKKRGSDPVVAPKFATKGKYRIRFIAGNAHSDVEVEVK